MKFRNALCVLIMLVSTPAMSGGIMVGGYASVPVTSPEVLGISKSAVAMKNALPESKKVRLVSIKKAETQVVAGMNFRLCLRVADKSHSYRVRTVVYRDLVGALMLTEWTPKGC